MAIWKTLQSFWRHGRSTASQGWADDDFAVEDTAHPVDDPWGEGGASSRVADAPARIDAVSDVFPASEFLTEKCDPAFPK